MFPYTHFSFLTNRHIKADDHGCWDRSSPPPSPTILLVEFRDEVFAAIRTELIGLNLSIARVTSADSVASAWRRMDPGLVIVNAQMPDQSGLLISHKLRLHGFAGELWMYSAKTEQSKFDDQEFCRIDRVFRYGGDVRALASHLTAVVSQRCHLAMLASSSSLAGSRTPMRSRRS